MELLGKWWINFVILLLGVGVGIALHESRLTPVAQARTLSPDEAVRLSQDLQDGGLSLASGNEELAKVARLLRASVVHIESRHTTSRGATVEETGSGVIMALPGAPGLYIITNRHVIAGNPQLSGISIQLDDGRFLTPTQVWQDKATDVAVLKLPDITAVPARWGDSDHLAIGHLVMALGSPFGLTQSVTLGIVSAKGRRSLQLGATGEMLNQDFIQTDAAINPGNSGGPLVDLHGRVVGINTAIASNSGGNEGIAFSVPSNLARRVAESLVKNGKVQRAYLGVKLDPMFTAETAKKFNLDRVRGARVLQVYEKTPAARAALQLDDIVLEFNGIEVQDQNHLINLVSLTPIGKQVRLGILRGGKRMAVDVLLADRTELDGHSEAPTQESWRLPARPTSYLPAESQGRFAALNESLALQAGFDSSQTGLIVLEPPRINGAAVEVAIYDVIVEAGGKPISSLQDWQAVWNGTKNELLVRVLRLEGREAHQLLVLWPKPDPSAMASGYGEPR